MPIKIKDADNSKSVELGAAPTVHAHAHADTTGKTANDHHNEDHAARHAVGGADAITITEAQISDLVHNDPTAIHTDVTGEISGLTGKTTPVDADVAVIEDSAATFGKKKVTWANIKATLKTYFDTLYAVAAQGVTNGDSHDHAGGDGAQVDHGGLAGLADDDHSQYHTNARHYAQHSSGRWQLSANQSILTATNTTVAFNTQVYEDDTNGDFTMNLSTGKLTINTAGVYMVSAGVRWQNHTVGVTRNEVILNDATARVNVAGFADAAHNNMWVAFATTYKFAVNDVVEVQVVQASGGNINVNSDDFTYFTIARLG